AALYAGLRRDRFHRRLRRDPMEPGDGVDRQSALAGQNLEHRAGVGGRRRTLDRICVQTDQLWVELLMAALKLGIAVEKFRLVAPFRISGYVFEEQEVVLVTLEDGSHRGRGEASGVYYLGDTALGNMVGSSLAMAPAF